MVSTLVAYWLLAVPCAGRPNPVVCTCLHCTYKLNTNITQPRASPTNVSTGAASAFLDVGDSGASKEKSQDKHHSTAKTSMKAWLQQEENKLKQYENDAEALSLQRVEVEMQNQQQVAMMKSMETTFATMKDSIDVSTIR
jgi:hypothetical protein